MTKAPISEEKSRKVDLQRGESFGFLGFEFRSGSESPGTMDAAVTAGPFQNPGSYRRDNVNANHKTALGKDEKRGFRFLYGQSSSGSGGRTTPALKPLATYRFCVRLLR
jgi:hypothetical protein